MTGVITLSEIKKMLTSKKNVTEVLTIISNKLKHYEL